MRKLAALAAVVLALGIAAAGGSFSDGHHANGGGNSIAHGHGH